MLVAGSFPMVAATRALISSRGSKVVASSVAGSVASSKVAVMVVAPMSTPVAAAAGLQDTKPAQSLKEA